MATRSHISRRPHQARIAAANDGACVARNSGNDSQRPILSRTRRTGLFVELRHSGNRSEQHVTEAAVLPAEVEQLPDLSACLKFASHPAWLRSRLDPN
jgi:hypothetical protein